MLEKYRSSNTKLTAQKPTKQQTTTTTEDNEQTTQNSNILTTIIGSNNNKTPESKELPTTFKKLKSNNKSNNFILINLGDIVKNTSFYEQCITPTSSVTQSSKQTSQQLPFIYRDLKKIESSIKDDISCNFIDFENYKKQQTEQQPKEQSTSFKFVTIENENDLISLSETVERKIEDKSKKLISTFKELSVDRQQQEEYKNIVLEASYCTFEIKGDPRITAQTSKEKQIEMDIENSEGWLNYLDSVLDININSLNNLLTQQQKEQEEQKEQNELNTKAIEFKIALIEKLNLYRYTMANALETMKNNQSNEEIVRECTNLFNDSITTLQKELMDIQNTIIEGTEIPEEEVESFKLKKEGQKLENLTDEEALNTGTSLGSPLP